MTKYSPFHYFKMRPEIIRLAVMMYVRFPLSHLYSRSNFKLNRAAALTEWRGLCAA
jgi:hypothetical protein